MRVEILGPVRVTTAAGQVEVPAAKERALLAALALRAGRVVTVDALVAALWGDRPPATARRTLQSHVSRLRGHLGSTVVTTEPSGVRLGIEPGQTDLGALERLVIEGSAAARRRDVHAAQDLFGRAEGLWRGEPLTDWAEGPHRGAQLNRMRGMSQAAREGRLRADLDLGLTAAVVDELQGLVAEDPLREPTVALLMLALYRSAAQLDALRAYRNLQDGLAVSWGVDPSPDLQRLQWQILRQDAQLDVKAPEPPLVVPAALTSFVGRHGQADNVATALAANRQVTLHGPAGVGKSRLAQEVARLVRTRFPDGVWWVDLAVVLDRADVVARVAQSLGVSAAPGISMQDALRTHLEHRELLLVCDNCEHVTQTLGEVMLDLLQAAPGVRVLATSRRYLGLPGETRWEVPPLTVPAAGADDDAIAACDAVTLFQQRQARRTDHPSGNTLADVAELCRRLDGLPLAVELAAGHTHQSPIQDILAQLGREAPNPPTPAGHHATVAQAIHWSYSELDPACQRLFDRLAVFPGDFDADAAERVAAQPSHPCPSSTLPRLADLVNASLVEARPVADATRYRLMFVMREFASARLEERGEAEAARQAFADHYRRLSRHAGPKLLDRDAGTWLQRLHLEWVNLQAALAWSMTHDPAERTLQFVRSMGDVAWGVSPDLAADVDVLHGVLERAEEARAADTAWGWQALVTAAYLSGDVSLALRAVERAKALFTSSADQVGLASLCWHAGSVLLLALGDLPAAESTFRRGIALAHQVGVVKPEAYCRAHLVQLQAAAGTADDETRQALQVAESLADPDDYQLQGHLRLDRALLAFAAGEPPGCLVAAQECADYGHQTGIVTYEQAGHLVEGWGLLQLSRVDDALPVALRSAQIALDVGNSLQFGLSLQQLARILDDSDDPVRAARTWGAATARAPVFPAFQPILTPHRSIRSLGPQFDHEQERGASLTADQALALAIT